MSTVERCNMPKKVTRGQKQGNRVTPYGRKSAEMASVKPSSQVAQLINMLSKAYGKERNAANAKWAKKYMRGQYEYFGLYTQKRRVVEKEIFANVDLDLNETHALLLHLWKQTEREFQYCGIDLAKRKAELLFGNSAEQGLASLSVIKSLITTKSWWDTVDMLAGVVGSIVRAHPGFCLPVMDQWVEAEDMWLRRTALIYQLHYKQSTDKERLFRYCLSMCGETEFFIQKAIGWSLQEYHKHNPDDVRAFVRDHVDSLAKLSVREALKHDKSKLPV